MGLEPTPGRRLAEPTGSGQQREQRGLGTPGLAGSLGMKRLPPSFYQATDQWSDFTRCI